MSSQFIIGIEGAWSLAPDEIWPDGDAPANPTREDAQKKVSSDPRELIDAWNLIPKVKVYRIPVKAYYFGCVGDAGHYLHDTHLRHVRGGRDSTLLPWDRIDGKLAPQGPRQVEGQAVLHHKDGWTALSFWDRSVDSRGGSNSNFFFNDTLTFEVALLVAQERFPKVWERFTFDVARYDPHV